MKRNVAVPATREPRGPSTDLRTALLGSAGLAVLILAVCADVLFSPRQRVLGSIGTDLATQFLFWRDFGFRELANGHIALWNPHIYAGAPYFGGMQAALLYPINWLFLFLPLASAVNWTLVTNIWLLGAFQFLWALRRGVHPLAALLAGALLMFGTPHFLHIYAGHLTNLAVMAWAPALFLVVDEWFRSKKYVWCLLGMLIVAMQILAGHPQYVFYTAITVGGYSLIRLLLEKEGWLKKSLGLLTVHPGGALLAAAQLVAGVEATQETIRGKRLPYHFVAEFDFPPENFMTIFAPGFFGNVQFYWGKGHLWEASLFIGVVGFALAVYGMRKGSTPGKTALVAMIPITLLLALGDNTPLLRMLYEHVPGFDRFRAISKFVFQTSLLLTLFAAIGLDRLIRYRMVESRVLWAAIAAGTTLCLGATLVLHTDWRLVMLGIWSSGKVARAFSLYSDPAVVAQVQQFSALALAIAGVTFGAFAAVAYWGRFDRRAAYVLGILAVVEVVLVARMNTDSFDLQEVLVPHFGKPGEQTKDYRILNPRNPNAAMSTRQFEIWGNDPGVTPRYAEFVFLTQKLSPDHATQQVNFWEFHRLLSLPRLKYAGKWMDERAEVFEVAEAPMSRLALIGSYRVLSYRDAIFEAMSSGKVDFRREVILEKEPDPRPAAAEFQGAARIVREGTDFVEIEADIQSPSVLLITDAWAPSWRAIPLEGSAQIRYEVMPANYAFRGIALSAGKHRLRMEYAPRLYPMGWWVSAIAWLAWLAGGIFAWRSFRSTPVSQDA